MACATNFYSGRWRSQRSATTIVAMVRVMALLRVMVRHNDGDGGCEQEDMTTWEEKIHVLNAD